MPYTTLVAGTTITAAWANANVRDQGVTPFATAAARTSAITVPVAGMLTYRSDGDIFEGYNGSAWKPITGLRNKAIFNSLGGCSLASTSSTYVDVTSASTSWTKIGASGDTDIAVHLAVDMYSTSASTSVTLGIGIGGTDYDVKLSFITQASILAGTHVADRLITGVAAGPYTPKLRAKRNSGAGTMTIDGNCTVSFTIAELPK